VDAHRLPAPHATAVAVVQSSCAPLVSGITVDGTARVVLQFTTTGTCTWTPPSGVTQFDYLIVAGGGGGAGNTNNGGGGGGAGGLLTGQATMTAQDHVVTVGSGGTGGTGGSSGRGGAGSSSSITATGLSLSAVGGGGGGSSDVAGEEPGGTGGSGGGSAMRNTATAGGLGTAGQGNNGGASASRNAGGGGGAGAVGGSATNQVAGNGGSGLASTITGSSVFYAGGGAGAEDGKGGTASGGLGGGGSANGATGGSGTANTGGGGAGAYGATPAGGAGGSGIVIVRYALPSPSVLPATLMGRTTFMAQWSSVTHATSYRLDVSTNDTFTALVPGYADMDAGTSLSADVTGLSQATSYFYRVRAVLGAVVSPNSSTVTTGTAATFGLVGNTTQIAGQPQSLTVTAYTPQGAVATGYTGDQTVVFGGAGSSTFPVTAPTVTSSSGTPVAFGAPTALTFSAGVASVTGAANGRLALYRVETALVSATDGALTTPSASRLSVAVSAAPSSQLEVTTQPVGGASGSVLATQPHVAVRDAYGNAISGDSTTVITAGLASGAGGQLLGPQTATAASGVATFSGLILVGRVSETYTMAFTASPLAGAVSAGVTVTAGAPAQLTMTTQPSVSVTNGTALVQPPVLQVRDSGGNAVAQAGIVAAAALASGGGVLSGTTSVASDASGQIAFSNLIITGVIGTRTLGFTAAGLTGTTSSGVMVTAGAATGLVVSVQPSAVAQSGVAFPVQPQVQVSDISGNAVAQAGISITAAIASGGGSLAGTLTTVTDAQGRASFGNLAIADLAGDHTLAFSASGLTPVTSNAISLTAGPPATLALTTMPPESAVNGQVLSQAPVVQLRDASGNNVAQSGVLVTVAIATGGGVLGGTLAVATGGSGSAVFPDLSVTGLVGSRTLIFTAAGYAGVVSPAIALTAGADASLAITVAPSSTVRSGDVLTVQPQVRVYDISGNPTSAVRQVSVALASGGGTLSGTTTVTTVAGLATFTNVAISGTVGSYALRFSSTPLTSVTSGSIAVSAGAATQVSLLTAPSSVVSSGVVFPVQPVLQLRDSAGNAVSEGGVAISASLASGGGLLGGLLTVPTSASGTAQFADLRITGVVGDRTLAFAGSGLATVVSGPVAVSPGAAAQLSLTTQPSAAVTSGLPFAVPPVVQVRDASGNAVAQAGAPVTVALESGDGALGGILTRTTDAAGQVAFEGITITGAIGTRTLRFTTPAMTAVVSNVVSVAAGPAAGLAIDRQPSTLAQVNVPLVQQPLVRLVDVSGNPVAQAGVVITVSLATGTGVLGGTLSGATGADGVATFSGLSIAGSVGTYRLSFTAPALASALSGTVQLSEGAPAVLAVLSQPSSVARSGVVFDQQPSIQLRDAVGNAVAQAGVAVTVQIGSGGGTLGGVPVVATDAAGRAVFSGLSISGVVGVRTLTFSASGFDTTTSAPVEVTCGRCAYLGLLQQPPVSAQSGAPLSAAPRVQQFDGAGNPTSTVRTVTVELASGTGTLSGTLSRITAGGAAEFADLVISGVPGAYTLRFTTPSLASVTSDVITLGPGAATRLALTAQPSSAAIAGQPLGVVPVVQLQDDAGTPVAQAGVIVGVAVASGNGTLAGSVSRVTDSGGRVSFTDLRFESGDGDQTLRFTAAGLAAVTSNAIRVSQGPPARLGLARQPSTSTSSGTPLPMQPEVQLQDSRGNPARWAGVAVTASVAQGSGALGGGTTVLTDGAGVAAFTTLALSGPSGVHRLSFASGGLVSVTSNAIQVNAGEASVLTLTGQPSSVVQSGVAIDEPPVVQVADAAGNAVAQAGVVVTATLASGAGALSGATTATTDATGAARFSSLIIAGPDGDRTLQFSAPGLGAVTSAPVAVTGTVPNRLAMVTPPSGASDSQVFVIQPVVRLTDAAGLPLLQAGVVVTASLGAGGGVLSVSGGGAPVAVTDVQGLASFAGLTISGAAGPRTVRFTATGYASVTTVPFELTCGSCAHLGFTTMPGSTARSGMPVSPAPVVQQYDASGNPTATPRVVVASLAQGNGVLSGVTSVTSVNGAARFDQLVITGSAGSYALRFSSEPLSAAVSDVVTLSVGDAAALALVTAPPFAAGSGVPLTPQPAVRVVDASGNPVWQSGVAITVALSSGTGTLEGVVSATTDVTGTATFTDLRVTGRGAVVLGFTAIGLTGVLSSSIQLVASGADISVTQTLAPASAAIGEVVTVTVTVSNAGPDSASALDVGHVLPTGLRVRGYALSQGGYAAATGRWSIGSLRPSASATATIEAEVTAPGVLASVALVLAHAEHDPQHMNNTSLVTLNGNGHVDLAVSHLVDYETPRVGDTVRFTTTVRNNGTRVAPQVLMRVPASTAFQTSTVTVTQGQYAAGTGDWTVGRLDPGAEAVLTRDAVMASAAPMVSDAAVISAGAVDLNSANDRDAVAVNGGGGVTVGLSAMALRPESVPFEPAPVLVTVRNEGPATATAVTVDLTAQGVTVEGGVPSSGELRLSGTEDGSVAGEPLAGIWTLPVLRPHESATLTLEGMVTSAGTAALEARLSGVSQPDLFAGDDRARAIITVPESTAQTCADLVLAMASPSFVIPGSVWTLRTTTTNIGPGYATDVETRVRIPRGTTLRAVTASGGGECRVSDSALTCIWAGATLVGRGSARTIDAVLQIGTEVAVGTLLASGAYAVSGVPACGAGAEDVTRSVQVADAATAVDVSVQMGVETPEGFVSALAISEGQRATVWLASTNRGTRPVATHYRLSLWDRSVVAVEDVTPSSGSVEPGPGEGRGRWFTGEVAPGDTVYLNIGVRMMAATSTRLSVERIAGTAGDPVADNDQASVVLDGIRDSPLAGRWVTAGRVRPGAGVEIVTGTGEGDRPQVRVFTSEGVDTGVRFLAFDPVSKGGVRVAACDLDRDGIDEIVAAEGAGGSRVRVFRLSEARVGEVASFLPFEDGFTGGVTVSCADTDGDQRAELIVGAGAGRPAEVRMFHVSSGRVARLAQWDAYPGFAGGVQVAAAWHPGNGFVGRLTVVTLPGTGRTGDLRGWRVEGSSVTLVAVVPEVFGTDTSGGHVAIGDLDGDQTLDVALAPTGHAGAVLRAYSLADGRMLGEAPAGAGGFTGTIRTAMADLAVPGIGRPELLVTGAGRSAPEVHVYLYTPSGMVRRVRLLAVEDP
jgi:uncharacterized repeat protein (TIGR01451 family)